MNTRTLIPLAVAAGLMSPVAAVITSVEHQKDSEPVMLALFVIPWLVGAYLVRRGKLTAGAAVIAVLSLLELATAPTWKRQTVADWTSQSIGAVLTVGCLVCVVTLLVQRYRSPRLSGAVR